MELLSSKYDDLALRVLDISYKHKLSHIGSVLSALPIIIRIYDLMDEYDSFILSQGHAGLALYVILEELGYGNAEGMLNVSGIHPDIVLNVHFNDYIIHASTGSLGQGLPIALGQAIADPDQKVYCLISDGECAEGSIWEALRLKDQWKIDNLITYVNMNGSSAYSIIDTQLLEMRLKTFDPAIKIMFTDSEPFHFLKPIQSHYHVMSEEDYLKAKENIINGY